MKITYTANGEFEESLGNLSIETKSHSEKSSYLLNLLASTIRREFYSKERKPLEAFKIALSRAGAVLEDFEISLKVTVRASTPEGAFLVQSRGSNFGKIKVNKEKIMKITKKPKKKKNPNKFDRLAQLAQKQKKLKSSEKVFLGAYGVAIVGLILSIFLFPRGGDNNQDILADALQKVNQAEQAISNEDSEEARARLEEAKDLVDSGDNDQIQTEIDDQLDKANKITRINNLPLFLLDFQTKELLIDEGKLYARKATDLSPRLLDFGRRQVTAVEEGPIAWEAKKLSNEANTIFYGTYLYSLDPENNQVIKQRYFKQNNTLGDKTNWIKEKGDLLNSKLLTIDGSIYVSLSDPETGLASFKKFYKGESQEFELKVITNEPRNLVKIFTSDKHDFIYLLEPNRVLAYTKEGELAAQYLSLQFSNLLDIAVTNDDNKIYLLNNNEILLIEVEREEE
tara:strand:- start:346 stop:1707 length:1362 start_codon:yes stop_codon:yes gene_type:complete